MKNLGRGDNSYLSDPPPQTLRFTQGDIKGAFCAKLVKVKKMVKKLSDSEIENTYRLIVAYHKKYLEQHGVTLPRLKAAAGYIKDALTLIYLAQDYPNTKPVSKGELTQFIPQYYPDTNDVQQARHLGMQKGWFIAAGGRDNRDVRLERGEYCLVSLEKPYPAFHGHRIKQTEDWENLKAQYGNRCVTCGSKEGEPNIHYPNTITRLQPGHKDPNKPLSAANTIPQCEKCNRADRNNWVYDERGRVIKLANPNVIKRSDRQIRWKVYKILYEEFQGRDPNE